MTYNDTLSRVTCTASALPSTADVCLFERSTDQIHWSQVRGGAAVTISSGSASVNDYEFSPGVPNYYRVSAVDTGAPTFVASSTAVTANNASVSPTVPAGYAEGDLLVIWASIRNSGTGSVVAPAGWTPMLQVDNVALLGRRATSSESTPTVTIAGGAANADVIAQMACFRNLELDLAARAYQLNPSAQNITYPPLAGVQSTWVVVLYLGWKQDDWTSVAAISGATEIGEPSATAGNDAGLVWDYRILSTAVAVASGAFVVTGGASAISYGAVAALRLASYVTRTTASVVPNMTRVWLKFPDSPYLNTVVTLTDWADNQRESRMGIFSVHGQRDAVAYSDVASAYTVTVSLWAWDETELGLLELLLSLGSVILFHVPQLVALDSMYAAIGTYTYERPAHLSYRAAFKVPMTEVAMPDISIVGNTVTCATLITNYGTFADVLLANATCAAILALTGTPADALVSI